MTAWFQEEAFFQIRAGNSVVLAMPTGSGKSVPLITASLESGKIGILISPLLSLEQQYQRDLGHLGIPFLNLGSCKAEELGRKLQEVNPQVILTSVEALSQKEKREALRKSRMVVGHIGWDEAAVCKSA